ncbi:hypothetical protein DTO164E3_36 [Paecilomyces variotii]|nr:hypothetical protein DTO032I3_3084 [Paecilomyces variotii]KAJ9207750.1 hypothetical protein DTO164E3_36 [Paecilomyces variotii]KAJ9245973.1 hypothetical protein DTO169E5_97 [Paecilomyces variotii]KAJ9246371.1 hypothetical protein DTO207G8_9025 [Paecilomyces variotii]KAJ9268673.1 hypothetical protein DTO212C5_5280 [Paecilomyces variotii]
MSLVHHRFIILSAAEPQSFIKSSFVSFDISLRKPCTSRICLQKYRVVPVPLVFPTFRGTYRPARLSYRIEGVEALTRASSLDRLDARLAVTVRVATCPLPEGLYSGLGQADLYLGPGHLRLQYTLVFQVLSFRNLDTESTINLRQPDNLSEDIASMAYQQRHAHKYQPCDSFFVETYEDFPAPHMDPKEHAKLVARERQYAMADELSRQASEEYQDDILSHMLEMDTATLPDVDSIDIQTEIQWFMRPYLLDFLIEAHTAFQLLPATLFLTINLLDRYCSKRVVYKRHYQLVGCAALLIAAKYGDKKDRVPTIKELKSMCCSLYDDDMFIQMEWHVLQTLGWTIGHPTVDSFLQIAVIDTPYDPEVEHLALYILEISLFHREFVSKPSADLSRAALALSRCILNRPQPRHTEWAANYDSMTLVGLSQQLHQPSQVLARKYSSAHYSRVSKLLEQFLARQASIASSYTPPSPPSEVPENSKPYNGEIGLATPQKQQYSGNMPNGYLTPPITPENEAFTNAQAKGVANPCPPSPTPPPTVQYSNSHEYQAARSYGQQAYPQQPQVGFSSAF